MHQKSQIERKTMKRSKLICILTVQLQNDVSGTNHLFRGLGGGTFVDVTNTPMRLDKGNSRGVSWADYDDDGYLDISRTMGEPRFNKLYRNNQDGTFSKVTTGSIA